ncbi:MAG: hypothetical protein M1822_007308 [Bathelium mastoideum]|nr:MAG: hypothetical protein M1822_007308 [Bathelium mastoideum]
MDSTPTPSSQYNATHLQRNASASSLESLSHDVSMAFRTSSPTRISPRFLTLKTDRVVPEAPAPPPSPVDWRMEERMPRREPIKA